MTDGNPHLRPSWVWRYALLLAIIWTALVASTFLWVTSQYDLFFREMARAEARAYFDNAVRFRDWVAGHGGVYVPISPSIASNEYLEMEEREVVTPSGRVLTLLNPAYAIRHLNESGSQRPDAYGRLTSLKPIRPENGPDDWEREALEAFETGTLESSQVVEMSGESYLRFIRPLKVKQSCLKCHIEQGFAVGDVLGGISITEPMGSYLATKSEKKWSAFYAFTFLWVTGLLGVLLGARIYKRRSSERERMMYNLIQARDAARAADTAKGEFLANISHELRTPLNGMLGMLKLLRTGNLDDDQKEYADIALSSGDSLMETISDLLDYSRAESGKLRIVSREFNLRELIGVALSPYEDACKVKGLFFHCRLDENLEGLYYGDEGRLRQVLINVVGNAVKFTEEGGVSVDVFVVGNNEDGDLIYFEITDTGIGIEAKRLQYLFEPFTQADGSRTRQYQGAGMGLGIVKRLVEAMGGNMYVESWEEGGTTVCITVRMEKVGGTLYGEGAGAIAMRVLLWSPEEERRSELVQALDRMGNRAIVALSVNDFVSSYCNEQFDCILIDGRADDSEIKALSLAISSGGLCEVKQLPVLFYKAQTGSLDTLFDKGEMQFCYLEKGGREDLRLALVDCLLNSMN